MSRDFATPFRDLGLGLLTIEQAVDRSMGMPGHALAYKIGQIEILDLRRRAKEHLSDEFDGCDPG